MTIVDGVAIALVVGWIWVTAEILSAHRGETDEIEYQKDREIPMLRPRIHDPRE